VGVDVGVKVFVFEGVFVLVAVKVEVLVGEEVKVAVVGVHCIVMEIVLLVTGPPPDQEAEP
jgi:hypothetical protein